MYINYPEHKLFNAAFTLASILGIGIGILSAMRNYQSTC